ncbi:hypothetical protein [Burkholderia sp. S171]|uniref:hypothetical protein n=1 Tax=Burkholderia sp. S171 TaxID=1641860 RepID=UPI00131B265E|nr:hypothetical protein [Burkholderia sp. S171]
MSTQLTQHAAFGIAYRLAMTPDARASALKAKVKTTKGFSIRIGLPNINPYVLDMTAEQFSEFKSTFEGTQ